MDCTFCCTSSTQKTHFDFSKSGVDVEVAAVARLCAASQGSISLYYFVSYIFFKDWRHHKQDAALSKALCCTFMCFCPNPRTRLDVFLRSCTTMCCNSVVVDYHYSDKKESFDFSMNTPTCQWEESFLTPYQWMDYVGMKEAKKLISAHSTLVTFLT